MSRLLKVWVWWYRIWKLCDKSCVIIIWRKCWRLLCCVMKILIISRKTYYQCWETYSFYYSFMKPELNNFWNTNLSLPKVRSELKPWPRWNNVYEWRLASLNCQSKVSRVQQLCDWRLDHEPVLDSGSGLNDRHLVLRAPDLRELCPSRRSLKSIESSEVWARKIGWGRFLSPDDDEYEHRNLIQWSLKMITKPQIGTMMLNCHLSL